MKVVTRFAPSPTGFIHVGSIYSAMLDFAFAKKHRGKFILRIEDTDRNRFVEEAEEAIYKGLQWAGLMPDESPKNPGKLGPYRQSERLDLYKKYAEELVEKGNAYYCFCSEEKLEKNREKMRRLGQPPKYDGCCRSLDIKEAKERIKIGEKAVIRMKIPDDEKIIVNDLIRGEIVFDSNLIDDQVLIKSDGFPTYHLAVVVDDHLMGITHTIRGEEWISSAPKHVLLYHYFGWKPPIFFHTPTLRNPDHGKLSKRQGHTSLTWYIEQGYLPEALLNFLCLLGWSHPKGKEIFSFDEFIRLFDLKKIAPIGPVFDINKLNWLNGEYIRQKSDSELAELLKPFFPKKIDPKHYLLAATLSKERIEKLSDVKILFDFLDKKIDCCADLLLQRKATKELAKKMLEGAEKLIEKAKDIENIKKLQEDFLTLIKQSNWNVGQFFMILRVALTGKTNTPPIVESVPILGKEKTIKGLEKAIEKLKI